MKPFRLLVIFLCGLVSLRAASIPELWAERLKSVVAVEYYIENEAERRPTIAYGTVIDDKGTVILPSVAINGRISPTQLKDFKVYRPGNPNSASAEYLGQDPYTGWHFLRVAAPMRNELVPITTFARAATPEVAMADDVWGIGLRNKEEDFNPYLLMSHVALVQPLPQRTGIAQQEVAGPGLPVFNRAGEFAGIALNSFGQNFIQFSREDRGGLPVIQVNVEESGAFIVAAEVLPNLGRVPQNIFGRPLPWLGAYGLEPIDPEVAKFLQLNGRSAAVVSEVLEGSPAEKAGLRERDILLALDGKPLPRLKPDRVVIVYLERELQKHRPGDTVTLTVLRDNKQVDLKVTLGDEPKMIGEAERKYFDRLGLTAREFVSDDAVARRIKPKEATGVVAHYIKPNGPASIAGLRLDDWIKEVDGTEVATYEEAVRKLGAAERDMLRTECVLLVSRGGVTSVLRIKL